MERQHGVEKLVGVLDSRCDVGVLMKAEDFRVVVKRQVILDVVDVFVKRGSFRGVVFAGL